MIAIQEIEEFSFELVAQEWHWEALTRYGERIVYLRRWHWQDWENSLVTKCTECSAGEGSNQSRVTAVYGQSGDTFCQACWGTGFNGGYRWPAYITYMLAQDDDLDQKQQRRTGFHLQENPQVQLPHLPIVRRNDIVVTYWEWEDSLTPKTIYEKFTVQSARPETIRSGLEHSHSRDQIIGWRAQLVRMTPESPLQQVPMINA